MKNNTAVLFFGLCPLIPAVTHFAEGCIFAAEFWLLFLTAFLCKKYIKKTKWGLFSIAVEYAGMFTAAVLYHAFIRLLFPLVAFQLTFYLYVATISYLTALTITHRHSAKGDNYTAVLYSILLPITGLVRELFAFGTITFAIPSGFFCITLIDNPSLRFFGSNAGTFILLGIGLWLFRSFQNGELLPFQE